MAKEVRLPQLGQTMEEGTVVNCLVKVGDEVKKADVIFEIETDKATLEMESPAEGFVKHILVQIDEIASGRLLDQDCITGLPYTESVCLYSNCNCSNEQQYNTSNDVILDIPVLKLKMPVVGVPLKDNTWDVN